MTVTFDGNDKAYLDWIGKNPNGYVVNVRRDLSPTYMVLHSTQCRTIQNYSDMARPGGFTERAYIKVCASRTADLSAWVRSHGRSDGSFSKECSLCGRA